MDLLYHIFMLYSILCNRKIRYTEGDEIMEIERKWLVTGWPQGLTVTEEFRMRQGYVSVRPTVRIREEALAGGPTQYILCFKSGGGLAREEVETPLPREVFENVEHKIIGDKRPLIGKTRRSYALPDGLTLEVNLVDEGQPGEFMYAEVEFATVEQANAWQPATCGLAGYLTREVTNEPGQSMGAYWLATRG